MKQYLLSVYQPDGDPPPDVDLQAIMRGVEEWDRELRDAGAWVFTGALHPASTATVVKAKDGDLLLTDGPYVEGKEHLGGFTVIRAEDLDAALGWAGKLGRITTLPIEVRPVHEG
ncbi:YciI family protein [Acrocarpospora macrocephala]|uniref:YCII-related domain-containing protein n=1 Tax=Acrocarpospora macrocephala TaxID=150177 RepID=A0A5M3X9Y7_9ACTN|nr:YciI family protein [Acrocarpospora macrocephala]GES14888.1 hypothetical protein Amac_084850 [Acrocarpospora macrocephala]